MRKLSKDTVADLCDMQKRALEAEEDLRRQMERYTDAVVTAWDALYEKIEAVNDIAGEAADVLQQAHAEAEEYLDDRSEKWRESPEGEAYSEWVESLDHYEFEDFTIDIDEPETFDTLESVCNKMLSDMIDGVEPAPGDV